jgi:hypothetical protein
MRSNSITEEGTWQQDENAILLPCESGQDLQDRKRVPGLCALLWLRAKLKKDIVENLAHAPLSYSVSSAAQKIGEGEMAN